MPPAVNLQIVVPLQPLGRNGPQLFAYAQDRQAVTRHAFILRAEDDLAPAQRRRCREREAHPTVDAFHGPYANLSGPNTSKRAKGHKTYPYLLRGLGVERRGQVWCADITYIPMKWGFLYLVAIMDWFTHKV